jgi:hypothetical protein
MTFPLLSLCLSLSLSVSLSRFTSQLIVDRHEQFKNKAIHIQVHVVHATLQILIHTRSYTSPCVQILLWHLECFINCEKNYFRSYQNGCKVLYA